MLLWREKIENVPIMSLQTGAQLGTASEPIVDPHTLKIIAFYCTGKLIEARPAILHTDDIREFGQMGFIINDSDDIMPVEDLVRLQDVINLHFELIGKAVIDTNKRKVGKVGNYIIESNSFNIMKLGVKRPLLQAIGDTEAIIDRRQIVEVTDKEIIVEAPTIKAEAGAKNSLETVKFQNPFRTNPQAEHIQEQK